MEKIDLASVDFSPDLLSIVPAATARMYETVPVRLMKDGRILLAMAPSTVFRAVNDELDNIRMELRYLLGREIELAIANRDQIRIFIERLYGEKS